MPSVLRRRDPVWVHTPVTQGTQRWDPEVRQDQQCVWGPVQKENRGPYSKSMKHFQRHRKALNKVWDPSERGVTPTLERPAFREDEQCPVQHRKDVLAGSLWCGQCEPGLSSRNGAAPQGTCGHVQRYFWLSQNYLGMFLGSCAVKSYDDRHPPQQRAVQPQTPISLSKSPHPSTFHDAGDLRGRPARAQLGSRPSTLGHLRFKHQTFKRLGSLFYTVTRAQGCICTPHTPVHAFCGT